MRLSVHVEEMDNEKNKEVFACSELENETKINIVWTNFHYNKHSITPFYHIGNSRYYPLLSYYNFIFTFICTCFLLLHVFGNLM